MGHYTDVVDWSEHWYKESCETWLPLWWQPCPCNIAAGYIDWGSEREREREKKREREDPCNCNYMFVQFLSMSS